MTGIAVGVGALSGVALSWWGVVAVAAVAAMATIWSRDRLTAVASVLVVAIAVLGAWRSEFAKVVAPAFVGQASEYLVINPPVTTGE